MIYATVLVCRAAGEWAWSSVSIFESSYIAVITEKMTPRTD